MAFSGLLAPWATGVEPTASADPAETLAAAVEDSVTTVTTADGEVVEAEVVEPAEEPAAPEAQSDERAEQEEQSDDPAVPEPSVEESADDTEPQELSEEPAASAPADSVDGNTHNFGTSRVALDPLMPVCEPGYVYGTRANGQMRQVSPDGTTISVGTPASGVSSFNGLGIGSGGDPVFAYERSTANSNSVSYATIYKYDTTTGTWSSTGVSVNSNTAGRTVSFVAGGVSLQNDRFYLGGFNSSNTRFRVWEYNPVTNTQSYKGEINTNQGTTSNGNGDLAFDAVGNMFVVRGSGTQTTVFSVTAADLAAANGGTIPASMSTEVTTMDSVNGVAFDSSGKVYLGSSNQVRSYDMPDWSNSTTVVSSGQDTTDLATCASPPTITIEKYVEGGRVKATDQFTMTLRQGSQTIGSATTTGNASGAQAERVGPLPTVRGVELTLTETAAGTTNLNEYVTSWRCYIDDVQASQGNGTVGTVTIPAGGDAVECIFFNSPLIANVTVHKDMADINGANPQPRPDWTVGVTSNATTGAVTKTPAADTATTNSSGSASWSLRFGTFNDRATVNVSEAMDAAHAFVSGECVATHLDGTTTTTTLDGPAAQALTDVAPGDQVVCTYVNKPRSSSLVVEKNWVINGTAYTHTEATDVLAGYGASAAPAVAPVPAGASVAFGSVLEPYTMGTTVTVNETVNAGSLCVLDSSEFIRSGGSDTYAPIPAAGVQFGLAEGANSVTFKNTLTCGASLTLVKELQTNHGGTAAPADWTLTATGPAGSFLTGPTGVTGDVTIGQYTLSESGPAGYAWADLVCVDAAGDEIDGVSTATPTVDVGVGADITCTFTNQDLPGKLTLNKVVTNNNGGTAVAGDWTLTADGPTPVTGTTGVTSDVTAGTYNLSETGPAGYTLTSLVCTADTGTATIDGSSVDVANGQHVTCTFTNDDVPAKLTLEKIVKNDNGGAAEATDWTLTATGPTPLSGTHGVSSNVNAGAYSVSESGGPANYEQVAVVCVDAEHHVVAEGTTGALSLNLGLGDDVTCTFTNQDQRPTLTLVKEISGADSSYTQYWDLAAEGMDGDDPFSFTGLTGVSSEVPTGAPLTLSEAINNTDLAGEFINGVAWVCVDETGGDVNLTDGTVVTVGFGQDVTCTIVNTLQAANPTIVKTAGTAQQEADGTWNIPFTVTVTNPSLVADVTYTLDDDLGFDTDLQINSQSATGPDGAIAGWTGSGPLATDVTLAAASSHDYTITVNVTVPTTVTYDDVTCVGNESGSGAYNSATLTVGDNTWTDDACADIPLAELDITKTVASVEQNADGTWTVTYDVVVTNLDDDVDTTYDLTDTLDFGASFTVDSAEWGHVEGDMELRAGTWNLPNQTATLATAEIIGRGAAHTYTVTAVVSVAAGAGVPQDVECGPNGGGFLNSAEVTFPGGAAEDEDCASPAFPAITKTIGDPAQDLSDGSWNVTYTVTVTGDADQDLFYNLSDTPDLGDGLVVNSMTATGPDGAIAGWNGGVLATAKELPAGTDHVYTIVVNVSVPTTIEYTDLECAVQGDENGTGLFNSATLTVSNRTFTDTACGDLPRPEVEVEKNLGTVNQTADGDWAITYEVVVTNNSDFSTRYDLVDTLDFGGGLTPSAASWASVEFPAIIGVWDLEAGPATNIATNMAIAAGATHTYTVTVRADVAAGTELPTGALCESGQDGSGGFLNVVVLTFPGGTDTDDACGAPSVPTVSKTFTGAATQGSDALWTVGYQLRAANTTADQTQYYTLTDTPAFADGVQIVSWRVVAASGTPAGTPADWAPYSAATNTIIADQELAPGTTHEWLVEFRLRINPGAVAPTDMECNEAGAGHGLFNTVNLTSGEQTRADDACGNIEEVGVPTMEKTVASVAQGADGLWTITYDVVVTANPDFVTTYSLSDTLRFGADVVIDGATWQWLEDPAAAAPTAWDLEEGLTVTMATDRVLAAGTDTHTYRVVVVAAVAQDLIGTPALDCELGDGEEGTGFRNDATLTSGEYSVTDDACASPSLPTITKDADTVVSQTADGDWVVSYDIVVTGGQHASIYDLVDAPAFAAGVSINNWSVTATGTTSPGISEAAWTDGVIATGVELAAGAVHTWTVTFNVSIAPSVAPEAAECDPATGGGAGLFNEATLTIGDTDLSDDDCVDIPEQQQPTVAKTLGMVEQNVEGSWIVEYTVVVTGAEDQTTRYDLTDTLAFGGGATINSAAWESADAPASSGAWNSPNTDRTTTLATDRVLAAGATHTYDITVVVDLAAGTIGSAAMDCVLTEGEEGTGFLNEVDLYVGDELVDSDDACGTPAKPNFVKTAVGLTNNNDGTFDAVYTLTVTSNAAAGQRLVYDITDTPVVPAGVTVEEMTVAGVSLPINPDWSLTDPVVAANVVLEQGATHVYTVTLKIRITEPIAPELRECDATPGTESGGLLNTGEVTSGNDEYPGEDCIDIPDPNLDVAKTLGTVNQQADGTWRVTYVVTVTNSAWVPGSYDLTDTIAFGGDITPLTAEWSLAGTATNGAWDDLPATTTATLATNRTIAARGVAQYDVVVTAEVAAGVIGSVAGECNEQGMSDGGGFLNTVELTWSGGTEDDSACGEPALPTITKTVDEQVVQDLGDASWIVSYDLVVTNPSTDSDLYYSLSDAPAFADGVTIEQWRVTPGDWADWTGTTGAIVSDELIEAGDSHTYTVEFRVRISSNIEADVVECDPATGEGSGLFNTALLTSGNDEVTDDDCIEIPGQQTPTVEKLVGTVTQGTDGRWTITYSVVVTGAEDQATRYDLSDTLRFGGGATIISAGWTWDDFDGITPPTASGTWADPMAAPSTVMAAQRILLAGETDTYTVTVVVDVATGTIDSAAMDCQLTEGEEGTGFLNAVDLYVGNELVDSDDACGIPAKPNLVKTAVSLTDNSDGTFDAVYTLTVTSNAAAGQTVVYDLADTPVVPAEVDVVSRTVTGEGIGSDVAWNDGSTDEIISGVTLEQGESHVYTVTLKVRVTEPMTPEQRECEATPGSESGGLLNTGEVTSGNDGYEAEDCIEIPDPEFGISKSVASIHQNLDGSWTVAYDVTVGNTSWLPGTYNLTDTLAFGGGLVPTSAAWTLQGTDITGSWTDPATEATATLATDRALGARDVHVYTVTVTADVEGGWKLPATSVCTGDDGLGGGGFLNTAEVTFPGGSDDAAACDEPTTPEIGKTFGSVTQTADASWDVTYVLTVDNTDGHATYYDLVDVPAFADGVTINGWSVTSGAGTPELAIDGAWTDGLIVTGLALEADGVHTYEVTFNVDIAVSISTEVLECSSTEVREGHGFFNEAVMSIGDNSTRDEDCGEIPEPGIPSLTKTLGTVEQTPDGLWEVTYVVTVTGDDELITRYDLVDELQFSGDAEVREANWTWDDAPEGTDPAVASGTWADPQADTVAVLATERVLGAGETDAYTVTVLADVAAGTIGSADMVCEQVNGSTEGRGFLNGAELWVGEDFVEYAEDCGEPAGASFSKTGLDLTANGDGSFTAVYELRVTSEATDGQVVSYDLTDTPVLPDGVELVSRSVTSDDATPNPTWADGLTDVMAIGQQIAQDEEHVYTVTLEVLVARPLTPAERLCESDEGTSGGLLNTGLLVSGNDEYSDEDCFELPDPEITIEKVVDHAIQTSPGIFEVTYTLTVENVSDVPGAYDLTDNLRYGDGATPTTGTWEREGGPTGEFDMTEGTSAQLATDEVLDARSSHVYTVVIIATVDVDRVDTVVGDCEVTETSSGSGFLNEATLAFEHSEVNDEACVVIDLDNGSLEITKELAGATSQFTGAGERMFQMQWSCTAPSGDTFTGTLDVAAGESRIASDDLPLGSVCTVVETAPSGGLANNHTWGEISYSAASVTLTEADSNQEITVTNTIKEPKRPLLPSSGADMAGVVASSGAALLLAMIVALGLAARRARRGQAQG